MSSGQTWANEVIESSEPTSLPAEHVRAVNVKPNWTYNAKLMSLHDGDTATVELDLGFDVRHTIKLRIFGVDCPELPTAAGRAAREFTFHWLTDNAGPMTVETIKLKNGSDAKTFERYVGILRVNGLSLADAIIAAGHGVATDKDGRRLA